MIAAYGQLSYVLRTCIIALVVVLSVSGTSGAKATDQSAQTQQSPQADQSQTPPSTPGPGLENCRFDKSVDLPQFSAIRVRYLALCFSQQISLMKLQEKDYETTISLDTSQTQTDQKVKAKLYNQQYPENYVILAVVSLIVLSGLVFSYLQFSKARSANDIQRDAIRSETPGQAKSPEQDKDSDENRNPDKKKPPQQDLVKFGALEVRSATLGVTILALSLIFFFLYLKFVYTIVSQ